MLSVRRRRRLSSPSAASASGRAPSHPPLVATTHPAGRAQHRADRRLALAARVCVGGVDEADARGDRLLHECDLLGGVRQPVRAEADPRHFDVAEPQSAWTGRHERQASRRRPPMVGRSNAVVPGAARAAAASAESALRRVEGSRTHRPANPYVTSSTAGVRARCAWTNWTAIAPSPTAVAHRLLDPERTSPAANTPGTSVSSRLSMPAAAPVRMKPSWSRATVSPSHSVHGQRAEEEEHEREGKPLAARERDGLEAPVLAVECGDLARSRTATPYRSSSWMR